MKREEVEFGDHEIEFVKRVFRVLALVGDKTRDVMEAIGKLEIIKHELMVREDRHRFSRMVALISIAEKDIANDISLFKDEYSAKNSNEANYIL